MFITGCIGNCQNDNFRCSQCRKFRQNDNIFVSVFIYVNGVLVLLMSSAKREPFCLGLIIFIFLTCVSSQAFLIAFTSEFLPKLLYQYKYNWDLVGYVNFTLAFSPNGTLTQECRWVFLWNLGPVIIIIKNLSKFRLKSVVNWNIAKRLLSITTFLFSKSFGCFEQSTAVILPCSMHGRRVS